MSFTFTAYAGRASQHYLTRPDNAHLRIVRLGPVTVGRLPGTAGFTVTIGSVGWCWEWTA